MRGYYNRFQVLKYFLVVIGLFIFISCKESVIESNRLTKDYNTNIKRSELGSFYSESDATKEVIAKLNNLRGGMGLSDVSLNLSLNEGALLHNKYMYQNNLLTHKQDPSNPFYDPVGASAGTKSILAGNVKSGTEALDLWLNSLYHRQYLLNPDLKDIGFNFQDGFATLNLGMNNDYNKSKITNYSYELEPVVYPFDGQKDVPINFDTLESPNPVPEYLSLPTGPFLTISFPKFSRIKKVNSVTLLDETGSKIPFTYFSMKNKDYVLAILPENPLEYKMKYIAEVDIDTVFNLSKETSRKDSREFFNYKNTWSFTTIGE